MGALMLAAAPALVKLGGDILGSIFSPSQSSKLAKQRASDQAMKTWQAQQITSTLKPTTPYYQSGNLPQLGSTAMQAVMGNLASRLGPDALAKWGINPAVQTPAVRTPIVPHPAVQAPGMVQPGYPQMNTQFPGQQMLLNRYGLS